MGKLRKADQATGWSRPSKGGGRFAARHRPPASPRQVAAARAGQAKLPPLSVGEQPGGVDRATWQRFRTGRLPAARVLDLHGHTAQHAFHSLATFVRVRAPRTAVYRGGDRARRCMRRELPLWLNLPEFRGVVLAAAHPHAANPGAVRLLLRRVR